MALLTPYLLDGSNLYSSLSQRALWEEREAHVRQAWRLLFTTMGAQCDLFEFNCFLGDRDNLPKIGTWISASSSTATGLDLLRPFAISEGKNPDPHSSMYWQVVGRLTPEALASIVDSPFAAHTGEIAPWFTIRLRQQDVVRASSHDWGNVVVFVTDIELDEIKRALAEISPALRLIHTRF